MQKRQNTAWPEKVSFRDYLLFVWQAPMFRTNMARMPVYTRRLKYPSVDSLHLRVTGQTIKLDRFPLRISCPPCLSLPPYLLLSLTNHETSTQPSGLKVPNGAILAKTFCHKQHVLALELPIISKWLEVLNLQ